MPAKKKKAVSTPKATPDMTMKAVVLVALALSFIGGYLVARAKYKPQIVVLSQMIAEKDSAIQKIKAAGNKVTMKDGKMFVVENGVESEMTTDVMMSNGTKVTSEGKVVKSDGSESMMNNGQSMDMDGNMMGGN